MTYYPHGKRALDLAIIGLLLPTVLLLSPLLLLAFLGLRFWHADGPLFFSQIRAGRHGKPFRIYKFRTLVVNDQDKLAMGHVRPDHPMATPLGRIMRRFKIDELPQLWNIVRGEMSFIGPRPVYLEMVAHYSEEQMARLNVLPGLTGWSQINGNCELTWDDRIRLDIWYVDHLSCWLDLRILLLTTWVVFSGEIVNPDALTKANRYWQTHSNHMSG